MKRRFVAFLILAVAATSTGLIFRIGEPELSFDGTTATQRNTAPLYERLPSSREKALTPAGNVNLTQGFAETITKELVNKNPSGPELIDGREWLNVPSPQKIAQNYIKEEVKKFKIEDLKPIIRDEDIRITHEKNIEVLLSYLQSFQKIQEALAQTSIDRQNFSIDDARRIENAYENIITALSSADVPEIFVPIHKTVLELFITQKNFLRLALNYENDPVQAMLAIQNTNFLQESIQENQKKFNQEIEKLSKQSFSEYTPPEHNRGIVEKLLYINRAYAAVPVIDVRHISATVSGFAESILTTIMEWAKDAERWLADKMWIIAVEALKKRLVDMIVDQIVRWIQGGGEPKFITDWEGFLSDAFDVGFDEVVKQLDLGFICSPFNLQVRLALTRIPEFSQRASCTLDRIVNNINAFYDDFLNGGWIAYEESWLAPQNNIYGAILLAWDEAEREGTEKQEAARNEGIANQSFLSIKRCAEFDTDEDLEGNPVCARYETVTPGKIIADAAARTVGADIDYIVNARDLTAYIAAIADAFINRLIRSGVGLVQGGDDSGGGFAGVSTDNAPPGIFIPSDVSGQCAGLTGAALSACIDAVEATQNLGNAVPNSCTGLTGQALDECLSRGCVGLEGEQLTDCLLGAPTATITSPANNSTVSGTITISATATAQDGIDRVEFYIDNVLIAADLSSPYSQTFDTATVPNGLHTIKIRAIDTLGGVKESEPITIIVNNVAERERERFGD